MRRSDPCRVYNLEYFAQYNVLFIVFQAQQNILLNAMPLPSYLCKQMNENTTVMRCAAQNFFFVQLND